MTTGDTERMTAERRSVVDEDGSVIVYMEYDDDACATVQIQLPVDGEAITVLAQDSDGTVVYEAVYEQRGLSFDPITVLGLGKRTQLQGLSLSDDGDSDDDATQRRHSDDGDTGWYPPRQVTTALNTLGFAPVPPGEGWLNG